MSFLHYIFEFQKRISTIKMDILNEFMDKNEHFGGKFFFRVLGMCAPWKKFGQKMKNFEIFFDVHMDTSVIDNNIKKNFEFFYFLAKFLYSNANAGCDKNHFRCKIFCLHQN